MDEVIDVVKNPHDAYQVLWAWSIAASLGCVALLALGVKTLKGIDDRWRAAYVALSEKHYKQGGDTLKALERQHIMTTVMIDIAKENRSS
jgi:hypothetical protein